MRCLIFLPRLYMLFYVSFRESCLYMYCFLYVFIICLSYVLQNIYT